MIDLKPYTETVMQVARDTRWLHPGADKKSHTWAAQTTITISTHGRIEVETALDWDSWQTWYWARLGAEQSSAPDSVTVEHFSISYDYTDAGRDPRLAAYPVGTGHDDTPIVLSITTPQFGDWHVFADLLAARGHNLALATTFAHDTSEDHFEPLTSYGIEQLLTAGTTLDTIEGPTVIELEDAGTVRVPSGHLAASDPGWIGERLRAVVVPPGDYPVTLSLMRSPDGITRVAAAKVSVTDLPVSTWEMALRPGEDARMLGADQFYGVGVNTGYAAFLDSGHGPVDDDTFAGPLINALQADLATELATPDSGGLNLIAFRAGAGDGSYPLWIGRDSDEQVSCVVLDFHLAIPK
ncbi:DUF4241 domain-containing protein [Nocardia tengchongensis]|uniref:DUF4241 domain-containing protein n=1 Tax=Nocardia tengchongensis TaxID=2055889 RepID=UPI0036C41C98